MTEPQTSEQKRPSVDERSFDLAEHFLQDVASATEDDKWALAATIQNAVEGWFTDTWCPICGGRDDHKPGCRDGDEIL